MPPRPQSCLLGTQVPMACRGEHDWEAWLLPQGHRERLGLVLVGHKTL